MSGTKILLDTNIIIYFLQGDDLLNSFLIDKDINISIINESEIYSGINLTNQEKEKMGFFLANLT
jgi:predicted nucleic acid-binding protein